MGFFTQVNWLAGGVGGGFRGDAPGITGASGRGDPKFAVRSGQSFGNGLHDGGDVASAGDGIDNGDGLQGRSPRGSHRPHPRPGETISPL